MKKRIIFVATILLVTFGALFSISSNYNGSISFIASAAASQDPPLQQEWWATCPDGVTHITVCSTGWNICTPEGFCP